MLVYFESKRLEYFFRTPIEEIKGKTEYSKSIISRYKFRIQQLKSVKNLTDLRKFRGLNFENLKADRKGECSIRLNDQYRLIFRPITANEVAVSVIEISKHYE
ncbi:MAG: type II toxin-antitoxin system RelE/ParE family toxin [Bacteroidia bacterium]|nr:type II toxin-antitoxin system RelE/ParE family toxin [Bacteroidia bacterium]